MLKISIIVLSVFLTSCAVTKPKPPTEQSKIVIDSSILKECPPLTEPNTSEEFSIAVIENTQKYAECKLLQHNSIKVIKKLTEE